MVFHQTRLSFTLFARIFIDWGSVNEYMFEPESFLSNPLSSNYFLNDYPQSSQS